MNPRTSQLYETLNCLQELNADRDGKIQTKSDAKQITELCTSVSLTLLNSLDTLGRIIGEAFDEDVDKKLSVDVAGLGWLINEIGLTVSCLLEVSMCIQRGSVPSKFNKIKGIPSTFINHLPYSSSLQICDLATTKSHCDEVGRSIANSTEALSEAITYAIDREEYSLADLRPLQILMTELIGLTRFVDNFKIELDYGSIDFQKLQSGTTNSIRVQSKKHQPKLQAEH